MKTLIRNSFYRSANCECSAIIYIEENDSVRIFRGSTIVFHRPTVDGINIINGHSALSVNADSLVDDMAVNKNAVEQNVCGRLDVTADYTFNNILEATRAVVGIDDVDPMNYWRPIFD